MVIQTPFRKREKYVFLFFYVKYFQDGHMLAVRMLVLKVMVGDMGDAN